MKQIAILIPTLKPGGAEKQAALLAATLDKHYQVDLYLLYGEIPSAPQNMALLTQTNVKIHPLIGNMLSKIQWLSREWKHKHIHILFNYLSSCDVIGALVGRYAGVERIYGGIRNARVERVKMMVERFVHNHLATGTVFNCYSGAEYFVSKGFEETKSIVIPNCMMSIAEPICRADRTIKHIVTVGRFVPQKDYETIIRALSYVTKTHRDFVMDIVGYGSEESNIRRWIKAYKVEDVVNLYINPTNVQEIVRDADIYFCASLFEGTSNSIMEALNWSLPVVATDVGDNGCLVTDAVNGMLHTKGDAESMARSIISLLDNVELRNSYGRAGNDKLRAHYSMEIFEKRYIDLIEQAQ